jgi:hypothetical protein
VYYLHIYQIAELPAHLQIHGIIDASNEEKYASVSGEEEPPAAQLKWQTHKNQVSHRESHIEPALDINP